MPKTGTEGHREPGRAEPRARAGTTSGEGQIMPLPTLPPGVDLAAAWALRALILAAALYVGVLVVSRFALLAVSVVVALLLAALLMPAVDGLVRAHVPRPLASLLALIAAAAGIVGLLTFAGRQAAEGSGDLADQVVAGLEEIRAWLRSGPLAVSDDRIGEAVASAQAAITTSNDRLVHGLATVTSTVGHVLTSALLVLFTTYFFLADGVRIWAWAVRVFPRTAQAHVHSSGQVAWMTLGAYARGTVIVATVDAVGIVVIAAILDVPLLFGIGVLAFLGAFVPIVGAFASGTVAVLVALVDQGPLVALFMLAGVILVQQVEAHLLQPFVLGKLVAVHPLGIVFAITGGVLLAGVLGALIAVPVAAVVNAVVLHLARTVPATWQPAAAATDASKH